MFNPFSRRPAERPVPAGAPAVSAPSTAAPSDSAAGAAPIPPGAGAAELEGHFAGQLAAELRRIRALSGAGAPGVDTSVLCDALEERFCGDSAAPLDGIRQIPAAAQETMGLCNDPDGSVVKLADVVNRDPTLTQALLRYANSAFYARSGQSAAVSIPDAVARVGVAGVRNVVLSVTVEGLVSRPGGELDKVAEAVWAHMVRVAPLARLIARAYPAAPETAFALGLLHDVGKMIVVDLASALRSKLRRPVSMPAPHTREILLALHEPLGGLCALRWNLGPEAARAIATHHRATPPAARDAMSEVLYLAERVDHANERREEVNLATLWEQGALGGRVERVAQALAGELDATVTF